MTDNGGTVPEPRRPSRLTEFIDPPYVPEPPAPPDPPDLRENSLRDPAERARREFAVALGEFRRTAVLVPFDPYDSLWTADQGGVRWICAFSDEEALARFASLQGDARRQWTYRTILGARLLDVMVPMLGIPAGVALDAGSDEGMLFPPVAGIVPDASAVGLEEAQ
ncbi:SseB family protein [Streptomyces inusitatus]|nr:SseB family protein [Streptomyces inusitatus]